MIAHDMTAPARPDPAATTPNGAAAVAACGGPHLLVWVGNNSQAEALVRHAAGLAQSGSMRWTAVCVEGPGPERDAAARPAIALRALTLAESLGARTLTVSTASVIAGVVECARRERASIVLVGGHAPEGWLDGLPQHWLKSLAEALSARLPEVIVEVAYLPEALPSAPLAQRRSAAPPEQNRDGRAFFGLHRADWTEAVLAVLVCTLVSELLLPYLALAGSATIYLAGVVYVALRQGQSASMLAVGLSILMFDLLVVEPRWSLTPIDPQYYFTFIVMAVVGWLVGRLAEDARQQARVAEARARRAQALNELAAQLLSAQTPAEVGAGLAGAVKATFGVESELLWPGTDSASSAGGEGSREDAADGERLLMPLQGMTGGASAVLAVRWPPGQAASPEERRLLFAFVNQAALAMQRAWFEQRSAAAAVQAEAERLRNTLLSGISHDFRTPLTTIIGSAASLLEQHDALGAPERAVLLRNIVDEAGRLHGSMSDLLDLTRMEEGAVRPRCEWCPADDLVQEARAALGAGLQHHMLRVTVPPEAIVWCDPRLVQRALVNLLDNALKHTPPTSTIDVRVELRGDHWQLVVGDDGPGLPAALARDPFKKFAHGRGETPSSGTGLGLAICAAVARLHDGRIEAVSGTEGGEGRAGTRFMLTLPLPGAPAAAVLEEPPA